MKNDALSQCMAAIGTAPATASAILRWEREWPAEVVRAALSQRELVARARRRFTHAEHWRWSAEGLEMATHPAVAAYHASLFAPGAPVLDITAGAGIDLVALSSRGPVIGVEMDEERFALLDHNVAGGMPPWEVTLGEITLIHGDGIEAARSRPGLSLFADPARRTSGARLTGLRAGLPDPAEIAALAGGRPRVVMKLWPGADPAEVLALSGPRVEVVSFAHEAREVLAIFGPEVDPGVFATRITETGAVHLAATPAALPATTAGTWIGEVDVAAARLRIAPPGAEARLGETFAYVTGDSPLASTWVRQGFAVVADQPFDRKIVRARVGELNKNVDAVKVAAGLNFDPPTVERELNAGRRNVPRELVVILYPASDGVRAAICTRLAANA